MKLLDILKETKNKRQHVEQQPQTVPQFFLSLEAIRRLEKLQLSASRYLPGSAVGRRPAFRRKPTTEFLDYRKYVHGDDVRFVDWKASARSEHIYLKQGNYPKEATVYVLLDCSASMAWGTPSKSQTALSLVTALGYLALAHQDRFVFAAFHDTSLQFLGPISGKGQIPSLFNYLTQIQFDGRAHITKAIQNFSHRSLAANGLVFVISDLLEVESLNETLKFVPTPTWNVTILHLLHKEELTPSLIGNYEFQDVETNDKGNFDINSNDIEEYKKLNLSWQGQLELDCISNNAFYTLIPSNWSLEREIIPHLKDVHILQEL